MNIEIDTRKNAFQNAETYFEKAKKAKAKLKGLERAMQGMDAKMAKAEEKIGPKKIAVRRGREWFEKFHWQTTSNGFLVLGGRDAHANEQLVKKFMKEGDFYFHADIQGAPHCILQGNEKKPEKEDLKEAAEFAAIFSKAWQSDLAGADVYSVSPEQVSKQAPSGESMGTGAFMVYGERIWYKNIPLVAGIGVDAKKRVQCGSVSAIKANCGKTFAVLVPGKESKSDTAKKVNRVFEKFFGLETQLDEVLSVLPNGNSQVRLENQR